LLGKITHVLFAGRDGAGKQAALKFAVVESSGQPDHVPGGAADIEPGNDA